MPKQKLYSLRKDMIDKFEKYMEATIRLLDSEDSSNDKRLYKGYKKAKSDFDIINEKWRNALWEYRDKFLN